MRNVRCNGKNFPTHRRFFLHLSLGDIFRQNYEVGAGNASPKWVSLIARKATAMHIQLTLTPPAARVSPVNVITVRITEVAPVYYRRDIKAH